jgi:hypothetical protein
MEGQFQPRSNRFLGDSGETFAQAFHRGGRVFDDDLCAGGNIDEAEFFRITWDDVLMQMVDAGSGGFPYITADVVAGGLIEGVENPQTSRHHGEPPEGLGVGELAGIEDVTQGKDEKVPGIVWVKIRGNADQIILPDQQTLDLGVIGENRAQDAGDPRASLILDVITFVGNEEVVFEAHV